MLRKRSSETPSLQRHPMADRWVRRCRIAWLVAIAVSLAAPFIQHEAGMIVMAVGLGGSTLLMILAATVGDNSAGPGDGDSGG